MSDPISDIAGAAQRTFPADVPTLIVSFGGVGSKMFARWLYPEADVGDLARAHRHWRFAPLAKSSKQTVVYLFGDPRDTILSFFQRRSSRHDRHGFAPLENASNLEREQRDWTMRALRQREVFEGEIDPDTEITDFLKGRVDLYRFEEHFQNWLSTRYPVLFVRYETLWDNVASVGRLLGANPATLPPFVPRRAKWQDEPAETQALLNAVYGPLAERLSALPDVFWADENGAIERQT